MRAFRGPLLVAGALLVSIILQTTLFGRVTLGGVAPDVVLLTVILSSFRLRAEQTLLLGFSAGLVMDALGSNALGLRAFNYTVVAYLATRTRERADYSPLAAAVWSALLTLVGVLLLMVVGTLFSQLAMGIAEAVRRVLLVPLLNLGVALLAWPLLARLQAPSRRLL